MFRIIFISFLFLTFSAGAQVKAPSRRVYLDKNGVIRWKDNRQEVALFGANYCLPSASDYRAAGYVTHDRKQLVDQDMAHFARMGWDGLRLCLWGDFENTDGEGNLRNNDHLDLMDYLMAKAKQRGIYFLLSPIVTYSSLWPDAMGDTASIDGISKKYKKSELGTNPKAIAAQQNYLGQLLNHVNPYTQTAWKDEPAILFIELINEPWHHSKDVQGSIRYINALVEAVRSTGCQKILFHNVSQDFDMAAAMQQSKVQGATFAWYPSGLNAGRTLPGNYLPVVDDYSLMGKPELSKMAKIVYEFDHPDQLTGYMFPAMVRTFRSVGAQFATMFSYDMLATAPYNLGWQTHFFNMVYTPVKAVSGIIAAEVMKQLPRGKHYGTYPANTTFGPFRISYEENLSEMVTADKFLYANSTKTAPPNRAALKKIIGYGSSPVVAYQGKGLYFLDKVKEGTWRLEVYPDAVLVDDPFKMPSPGKVVSRAISRNWPMEVLLPDLGSAFSVVPLNAGNTYATGAREGKFSIQPGVYILSADPHFQKEALPRQLGYLGIDEFIAPKDQALPLQVVVHPQQEYPLGKPLLVQAEVYGPKDPESVTLFVKQAGPRFVSVPMKQDGGYTYTAALPAEKVREGWLEYCIVVKGEGQTFNFPSGIQKSPYDWDYYGSENWKARVVGPIIPLRLLHPAEDEKGLAVTRMDHDFRFNVFKLLPASHTGEAAFRLEMPWNDPSVEDYTVSVPVKDKISGRKEDLSAAQSLVLEVKGVSRKHEAYITLVESDGTSWSRKISLDPDWKALQVPLRELQRSRGAMLPLGYPGRFRYWFEPAANRGGPGDRVRMEAVEWLQLSLRPTAGKSPAAGSNSWIEITAATVMFHK
ncbi:hypothetical protein V9K67_17370 [Paraflavisolibacter sp. H34]|uniref:hypothetical protein n=1 Tax=Huijunlia imazamoxiresistens TaxID=3127457 RepID=UPI00301B5DED